MIALGVVVLGSLGALTRYFMDDAVSRRTKSRLPYGTQLVNVTGSFLLGFVTGLVLYHSGSADTRTLVGTGFCGALTTWSTLSWETVRLVEDGETSTAVVAMLGGVAVCLLAAALGLAVASL